MFWIQRGIIQNNMCEELTNCEYTGKISEVDISTSFSSLTLPGLRGGGSLVPPLVTFCVTFVRLLSHISRFLRKKFYRFTNFSTQKSFEKIMYGG